MVDGRLVAHDEKGEVYRGSDIFVQFLAPVTEESAKSGITLYDESAGAEVKGSLRTEGKNRVYFIPSEPLAAGHRYSFKISDSLVGVNGLEIESGVDLSFTY